MSKATKNFSNITIKQFRALQATIDSGSMIAAAEKLNVTPPAISLQLRLLEEIIGMPVIERLNGVNELTDIGKIVLKAGKNIDSALLQCQNSINKLIGHDTGHVNLGITSMAKYFTPLLISSFLQDHADIDISLNVDHRADILNKLQHHELDMAIMGEAEPDSTFDYLKIGTHPQVLVGSVKHPLCDKKNIDINDFNHDIFLMREEGSSGRILLEEFFDQLQFHPPKTIEINSNEMIKQSVIAGVGVAIMSTHIMINEINTKQLAIFDVKGLPIERNWYAVKRKSEHFQPSSQIMWDFIIDNAEHYMPKI